MTSVLHVIPSLATGGAETTLVNLACELQRRGQQQHVVSLRNGGSFAAELHRAGVAVTTLDVPTRYQAPLGIFKLMRVIQRQRPGIVQGWMYHGNLMATLSHGLAPGRSNRKLLWNLRASNMDLSRYGRDIRWGAALSKLPYIIIANSEAGAAFHSEQGYRARQIKIVANGIDTDRFRPDAAARSAIRMELDIPHDAVVVMHAARVDPMKDHVTCLAALAANPGVTGILVGAGTRELRTPSNVRALGLRHDVSRLYAAADIVMSSSAFGEGFSNAAAEGMSAGLVPVCTDVGDARLIVADTGRIVAPGDPQALAAAIAVEAEASPSERVSRGLAARARIVERFSLTQAVDTYERLYRSLSAQ